MPPEDEEGAAGGPTPDDADNSSTPAPVKRPVDADRSDPAAPRQPSDDNRPVQLPIPGLDVSGGEDVDDLRWRADAEAELRRITAQGEDATADRLRAAVGVPSEPNLMGNVFMAASVRGELRKVGYIHSKASSRHGGVIAVWRAA